MKHNHVSKNVSKIFKCQYVATLLMFCCEIRNLLAGSAAAAAAAPPTPPPVVSSLLPEAGEVGRLFRLSSPKRNKYYKDQLEHGNVNASPLRKL